MDKNVTHELEQINKMGTEKKIAYLIWWIKNLINDVDLINQDIAAIRGKIKEVPFLINEVHGESLHTATSFIDMREEIKNIKEDIRRIEEVIEDTMVTKISDEGLEAEV